MKPDLVVIGHGNMMNSRSFLIQEESSLVYQLLKEGYYVYLVNFRGNFISNSHMNITDRATYWDFSFDQMGKYDMPAIMKEVHRASRGAKSVFLGYGMANTAAFVYASTQPEEAKKYLKGIVAWAPLVYLSHMKSLFWYAAQVIPFLEPFVKEQWQGRLGRTYFQVKKFCTKYTFQLFICNPLRIPFAGDNFGQINPEVLPLGLLSRTDPSSYSMLVHYSQMVKSGKFEAKDLGKSADKLVYRQQSPTRYDISKVSVPVALYYGPNDWLTDEVDVAQLYYELNPKVRCGMNRVKYPKFSHNDFIEGKNASTLLFKPTMETIAQMCTEKCKP
ncbi:unnamed protein product [Callosobruchus maculatus]|uniref:Uncharacterized protein n=1 Tax=Callosobruchus maculatus TaxID=64391 RepID=A0A653D0I3_CALMS|nr:unnamed protein product [Callosobruchus maculatus]